MNIERKEKVANRAAFLTILTIVVSGWFFPTIIITYLLCATAVAALAQPKEFSSLIAIYFPIFAAYGLFYVVLEYKKIVNLIKASLGVFKRHF